MPPADIADDLGGTPAHDERKNSLSIEIDEGSEHQRSKETVTGPQEAKDDKTQLINSHVQTASGTENNNDTQQELPHSNRPMSFSLERWLCEPKQSLAPVIPTPSKPWLEVRVYVSRQRLVRDHKHIEIEPSISLDSFNTEVFDLYYRELAGARQMTRRTLDKDSIRGYAVHYATGGSDNVTRLEAHDNGVWRAAFDRLHNLGVAGQSVLNGHVEVHF